MALATMEPDQLEVRPVFAEDLAALYRLAAVCGTTWHRLSFGASPSPHDLPAVLQHNLVHHLVVEDRQQGIVGYAALFDGDEAAGRVRLEVVVGPGRAARAWRAELTSAAVAQAFDNWPFDKVSAIHHGFERSPFDDLGLPVLEEGCLRECYLHAGTYWDRYFTAVWRDGLPGAVSHEGSDR